MKNKYTPEIRFSGFTENWEQREVGDFYFFKNGLNKEKEFFGSGTPIVNFTDVFHNRGLFSKDLKGKVQLTQKEINNYEVQQGDIFFTRTSETIEEIGYPSVMIDNPINTVFSGFVLRGRAIENDPLVLDYKRYVFFTNTFREEMKKKSSMTTRALTSGTAIKEMLFNYPKSKVEQEQIGKLFKQLDDMITLHQQELTNLKQTKQGFLQKMFPKEGESMPKVRFPGFTGDWEQRKLGEILKVNSGRDYKHLQQGNIPVYGTGGYMLSVNDKLSDEDAIGIGRKGTINNPQLLKAPFWTVDTLFYMTTKEKNDLLFCYSLANKINWKKYDESTGVPSLSKSSIDKISISIPTSGEQSKIGNFFKQLDDTIALHQRELDALKETKKAFLQKMFV